jgi:tetratricopeptide (TPR) repeat protein
MSRIVFSGSLVLWLACAGCGRTQTGSRAPSAESVAPTALCLQDPRGPAPADTQLRTLQQRARAEGAVPDAWVATGHAWVRKARVHAQPALYRNADACAQAALDQSSGHAAALGLRGLALLNDHRFAEARDLAQAVLARDADDPMAWGVLSDAQLELGDLDAAIDAAQRLIDCKPELGSYGRAAHLRWLQGDVLGAKRVYAQAIAAGRGQRDREPSAWMMVQAALIFWHEGDYAGADAGFDAALAQVAGYPPALEGKGRVALALGAPRDAERWFERALAQRPSVETTWLLGDALALAGDARAAERAYARVEREGAQHDPRTLAAFYATQRRRSDDAVRLARAELAERADLYTKDTLAWALHRAGRSAEARRYSDEALAAGTPDARLLFHAGEILAATGDADRGRALIERALRLNPGFDPRLVEQTDVRQSL